MKAGEFLRSTVSDDWTDNLRILRSTGGRSWAAQLGGVFGVDARTPQRWAAAAGLTNARQTRTPSAAQQDQLKALVAAAVLPTLTIAPGNDVEVTASPGKDPRHRAVQRITGTLDGATFPRVVDALKAGDWATAAEQFDVRIMDAYGGLGSTLFDCDYNGIQGY